MRRTQRAGCSSNHSATAPDRGPDVRSGDTVTNEAVATEQPERPPFDPSGIRAVAFDAYGTLFDWEFRASLADFLTTNGVTADIEVVARTFSSEAFSAVSLWAPGHRGEDGKLDRKR